jgi:hypothetical protein
MMQTFLFYLVLLIGLYYAYKNGNKAKKAIQNQNKTSVITDYSTMVLWEDDYLMVEIMSADNLNFAKKQIGEITHTEDFKKIDTVDLKISKTELSALLESSGLIEFEKIMYAGIGEPHLMENPQTRAFGDLHSAIFFDGATEEVEHIWLSSENWTEINKTHLLNGLHAIGTNYNLILVDFYRIQNKIVDLKDKTEIQNYFNVFIDRFTEK